ncbi:unnamed protein product [Protopolystoma xenopodis]|uniref:Uncharacterized protein n=1 Tax=Protopolystoma xenopodis TaxID=117903 RepID=A0A3S5BUV6_9PLAT|nr:unnamed protein product [Protopolystoma xenopodis]
MHYLNMFETLQMVTTKESDWSIPSLEGAGLDGLSLGDPSLVDGTMNMEKLDQVSDNLISDSEEEGGKIS